MFNKQYLKNSKAIKYNSCCSCLLFLTLTLKFYSIVCNRSSHVILWAENWFLFSSEWQMKKTKQRAVFSLGLEWMKSKRVISSVLLPCYKFISWCGAELLESRMIKYHPDSFMSKGILLLNCQHCIINRLHVVADFVVLSNCSISFGSRWQVWKYEMPFMWLWNFFRTGEMQ